MPQPCTTPIRELGLAIAGSPLEPVITAFEEEVRASGLIRLHPRYYLSTEWGVPHPSISIAIPFYLARADLTALHLEKTGIVEGRDAADVLRYLRHELGHVVNYAYRLHDEPEWEGLFGSIRKRYREEYSPRPFSRCHVRHLPGWYAQKHPDEDWAETFAVWMTPGGAWRDDYATMPKALAKLEYCDRTIRRIGPLEPLLTEVDADEDVSEVEATLDEYYADEHVTEDEGAGRIGLPLGIGEALRSVFTGGDLPARALLARLENDMAAAVYCWTGRDPARTRSLVRRLARRSDGLSHASGDEPRVAVRLTALVTTLAQMRRRATED